jgi:hypothetical protein
VNRPRNFFFDEISVTYGYLGDLNSPGVNKRFRRLTHSDFHRFILLKQIGGRARASADYTFEAGIETAREAIRVRIPELRLIDMLHLETYQSIRKRAGYGLAVYGERSLHPRVRIGGGYSQVDHHMLNSDRYGQGKRVVLTSHLTVSPVLTVMTFFTRGLAGDPPPSPRNRFDLILSYDLLRHLKRTGIF